MGIFRQAPSYPPGIEAVQFRVGGVLKWAVHYTPHGSVKSRILGIITQTRNGHYLISSVEEQPTIGSKTSAIWWLYDHEIGCTQPREDR